MKFFREAKLVSIPRPQLRDITLADAISGGPELFGKAREQSIPPS
jgi:hypothetical protein